MFGTRIMFKKTKGTGKSPLPRPHWPSIIHGYIEDIENATYPPSAADNKQGITK